MIMGFNEGLNASLMNMHGIISVLVAKGVTGETYNIGTQRERTVRDVARDIAAVFNLPQGKISHVRDRAFNDRRRVHTNYLWITEKWT